MIPNWTLEDRLRKSRELTGMRQEDLASRLKLSKNTVCSYETGATSPDSSCLLEWARVTDVDPSWLIAGSV